MSTPKQSLQHRTWTRDNYLISTDPSLIPVAELNAVFATDLVYWADSLPEDVMRETLSKSLCFGLYSTRPNTNTGATEDRSLIGFARCVTDFTTFSYLTDVYVLSEHQGGGLGKWLVKCVGEAHDDMPFLRRIMLFTSDWDRSVPFYEAVLGMGVLDDQGREKGRPAVMQKLGPGFPKASR